MIKRRKYTKKYCRYCESKVDVIDYKDVKALKHSLSERYKIMPRRLTGNCKRHQDMATAAIKKSRHAAFIPYVVDTKKVSDTPYQRF